MNALKRIEVLLGEAGELAVKEIERRARAIMREHPRCASFCMGMGRASFYDAKGDVVGDWGPHAYPKYLQSFDTIVNDLDRALHVTGTPMKIEGADASTVTNW